MADSDNKSLVERYVAAMAAQDYDAADLLCAPGFVMEWPASHERIHGRDNFRAIHAGYPGLPSAEVRGVTGAEDRWVSGPMFQVVRVAGSGDLWIAEMEMEYPSGDRYMLVSLLTLKDGKIAHETQYFAEEIEPPEWRSQWVEHLPSLKEQRQP